MIYSNFKLNSGYITVFRCLGAKKPPAPFEIGTLFKKNIFSFTYILLYVRLGYIGYWVAPQCVGYPKKVLQCRISNLWESTSFLYILPANARLWLLILTSALYRWWRPEWSPQGFGTALTAGRHMEAYLHKFMALNKYLNYFKTITSLSY